MAGYSSDILSALAGKSTELAFSSAPPYSSPDLLNIFPRSPFNRRRLCGSRPGLKKAFAQQLAGTSVDLIAEVREATSSKGETRSETFDTNLGDPPWTVASWLAYAGSTTPTLVTAFPLVQNGYATFLADAPQNASLSMFLDAPANGFDSTAEYSVTANVRLFTPTALQGYSSYSTWLRMDNTTPNGPLNGVLAMLTASFFGSGATWTLDLITFSAGAVVDADSIFSTTSAFGTPDTTWSLIARVNADATANKVILRAVSNHSSAFTMTVEKTIGTAAVGERVGWSMVRSLAVSLVGNPPAVQLNQWDFQFTADNVSQSGVRNRAITVGGTHLMEENNASTLIDVTETTNPTAGRLLQAVDLRGKLYIVNYAADSGVETTEPEFLIYDPAANTLKSMRNLNDATDLDVVPLQLRTTAVKCELITTYRDALLLAGKRGDGNEWYLTKRGADPAAITWDATIGTATSFLADTSVTSFVVGSTSEAGRIGEPITALMRHSDDYMLFGCQSSVWILRGDPNLQGTIDILDPRHGVISASAHCRGPGSSSFFLALDGLYVIPYGGQQEPIPLSKKLPQELRYINLGQNRVFLAYDVVHEGIIIAVTRTDGGKGSYFFYNMDTQGFFPMEFPSHCEPTFLHYYSADSPGQRAVLFGGRDGYIRQFDDFGKSQNDDGVDWTSRMVLGPLMLGGTGYEDGVLREACGELAIGSGDVTVTAMVAASVEKALTSPRTFSFTLKDGIKKSHYPLLRGGAAYLKLEKTGGNAWGLEKVTVVRERLGKQRSA